MRWPWIRGACVLGALLPALAMPLAAAAQVESREGIALQNQLFQLRQELQVLRGDIGRQGGGYGGGYGGGPDIAAQLLSRVQAMEEQIRQLRGKIDETQNLMNRQNAELSKRIDDLTFQLNLPGKGASAAPMPNPPPPPPRQASRPGDPSAPWVEPTQRYATPDTSPLLIPAPPPPPKSFTFNQTPEPMREAPRPPPLARTETGPRPPDTVPDPAPRPAAEAALKPPPPPAPPPRPPETALTDVAVSALGPGGKRTPEMALQEGHAALARRDYAAAERSAREVMGNRTSPRAYDGQLLLAQSLAGQKQFAQAAIAFDDTYNRSHKGRHAQDALLGLAGALTAINEKRAACDTLGRLTTEFPQVRADLQEVITRTNDRAGCGR